MDCLDICVDEFDDELGGDEGLEPDPDPDPLELLEPLSVGDWAEEEPELLSELPVESNDTPFSLSSPFNASDWVASSSEPSASLST